MSETTPTREAPRRAISFKTSQGSVYTYDNEGKTSRFQPLTGMQHERQDITVFASLSDEENLKLLAAIHKDTKENKNQKVIVVERQADDKGRQISDVGQIKDPQRLYLAVREDNKLIFTSPASLQPEVGRTVFDYREFEKDGTQHRERHLGNEVVEIEYEK